MPSMDKKYWEKVYSKQSEEEKPSLFAVFIAENLGMCGKKLVELGCGNGRDAIYFANAGAKHVDAIDQCENIINLLTYRFQQIKNLSFHCQDFTCMEDVTKEKKFDIIYSRFTLHSISKEQEQKSLNRDCYMCHNHFNHLFGCLLLSRTHRNELLYISLLRQWMSHNPESSSCISFFP